STELKDTEITSADQKAAYYWAKKDYEARLEPVKNQIAEIEKRARGVLHDKKLAGLEPKLREALDIPKDKRTPEQETLAKNADEQIEPLWSEVLEELTPTEREPRAALRLKLHEIEQTAPDPPPAAYAVADSDKPAPATFILKVGDVKHKMGQVEPGVLTVLNTDNVEIPASSARRPRDGEPHLAIPDGYRDRRYTQRFRRAGAAADEPETA